MNIDLLWYLMVIAMHTRDNVTMCTQTNKEYDCKEKFMLVLHTKSSSKWLFNTWENSSVDEYDTFLRRLVMQIKKFKVITMGWYPDKLSVLSNKKILGHLKYTASLRIMWLLIIGQITLVFLVGAKTLWQYWCCQNKSTCSWRLVLRFTGIIVYSVLYGYWTVYHFR